MLQLFNTQKEDPRIPPINELPIQYTVDPAPGGGYFVEDENHNVIAFSDSADHAVKVRVALIVFDNLSYIVKRIMELGGYKL